MNVPTIVFVVFLVLLIFWTIGRRYIQFQLRVMLEGIESWKSDTDFKLHYLRKDLPDKFDQEEKELGQKYTKKVTEIYKDTIPILVGLLPFSFLYRKKILSVYNKGRPDLESEADPRLWFDLTRGHVLGDKPLRLEEIDGLIQILKWTT